MLEWQLRIMNEKQFSDEIWKYLKESLKSHQVSQGESLLYKLIIGADGKTKPEKTDLPSRGHYAFQTDILVKEKNIPLVVVELKYGGFSTHDVLVYSTKAIKHKEIYSYLRYGLVVGGQDKIDGKFFIHNVGFDFALAIKNIEEKRRVLDSIVKNQIKIAKKLITILEKKPVSRYETEVKVD